MLKVGKQKFLTEGWMGNMDGGAHAAGEGNLDAKFHRRCAVTQAGARPLFVALNVPVGRPRTLDTTPPPKKRKASAASSSLVPLRSLHCDISPLMMKVCLYLWGNFAGYISNSHAALTL